MATQVQFRRGSKPENDAFKGAVGEVTVDTTNQTLRVHDASVTGADVGVTPSNRSTPP